MAKLHSSGKRKPASPAQLEKQNKRRREQYASNPKAKIARVTRRQRERYHDDPEYMLRIRLRSRIKYAVRAGRASKKGACMNLVGCTAEQFVKYIERLFEPGMSWENKGLWHIDHIIPVSAFDLTTEAGQQAAFHYTNMQPMWAKDNLIKKCRPPTPQKRFDFGYIMLADDQRRRALGERQGRELNPPL